MQTFKLIIYPVYTAPRLVEDFVWRQYCLSIHIITYILLKSHVIEYVMKMTKKWRVHVYQRRCKDLCINFTLSTTPTFYNKLVKLLYISTPKWCDLIGLYMLERSTCCKMLRACFIQQTPLFQVSSGYPRITLPCTSISTFLSVTGAPVLLLRFPSPTGAQAV